ncbi:hypothetical protein Tco_0742981, partial [Tanacetum coccineum]
ECIIPNRESIVSVYDDSWRTSIRHLLVGSPEDSAWLGIGVDGSVEDQYTELLEPIPEPHQVQQNDSNVIYEVSSVEQDGRTVDQHPATVEETCAYFESFYNNLAIEVEKVNSVNRKMKETNADLTTELARYKNQEKSFEIS